MSMESGPGIRKALFFEERGEPITGTLKALREHTYDIPAHPENPDEIDIPEYEKIKPEAYALVAYVLERIHSRMMSYAHQQYEDHELGDVLTQFSKEELRKLTEERPEQYLKGLLTVKDRLPGAFFDAFNAWVYDFKNTEGEGAAYDKRVFERLTDLLMESDFGTRANDPNPELISRSFIQRGIGTAVDTSWDLLRAIPIAYYNKTGEIISEEEYERIASESESIVTLLSSVHIANFSQMFQFADKDRNLITTTLLLEFPLEFFEMQEGKDGRQHLLFSHDVLRSYEAYREEHEYTTIGLDDEKRLGCPARDARVETEEGKTESGIRSIYNLHREYAREYLLPYLKAYTNSVVDQATTPK